MGQLVDRLKALGLYDRTLIVFTSDHGDEFGEHNPNYIYDMHGHTNYEEIIHVPLILKLPHQADAGTRVAACEPSRVHERRKRSRQNQGFLSIDYSAYRRRERSNQCSAECG